MNIGYAASPLNSSRKNSPLFPRSASSDTMMYICNIVFILDIGDMEDVRGKFWESNPCNRADVPLRINREEALSSRPHSHEESLPPDLPSIRLWPHWREYIPSCTLTQSTAFRVPWTLRCSGPALHQPRLRPQEEEVHRCWLHHGLTRRPHLHMRGAGVPHVQPGPVPKGCGDVGLLCRHGFSAGGCHGARQPLYGHGH